MSHFHEDTDSSWMSVIGIVKSGKLGVFYETMNLELKSKLHSKYLVFQGFKV